MPREFEQLQPHEFEKLIDGYKKRKKEQEFSYAYFTACIMNTQLKEPITPHKILEPIWKEEQNERQTADDEEYLRNRFKMPKGGTAECQR